MKSEIDTLKEQLESVSGIEKVDILNRLSDSFFDQSETTALEYAKEALDLARETRYRQGEAIALRRIGKIFYELGDYTEAMPNYQASLEIEKEINIVPSIAGLLNNIAKIHGQTRDFEKALEINMEAMKLLEGTVENDSIARIILNNIGNCYLHLGDYDKSLEFYKRSLSICEESGDLGGVALNLSNIALLHQNHGKIDEALEYYRKALDIRKELKHKFGLASTLIKMGNCIMESGEISRAREYLEEGMQIAEEENFKDLVKDGLIYTGIVLEQEGKYKEALDFHKRSFELRETIYNEKHSQAIAKIQAQFDLKQKMVEIEELEAKVRERTADIARKNEELELDITERKLAEEALRQSDERYRSLIENAPNMIMTVDCDGNILSMNRIVPGLSPDEVIGKNHLDFVGPEYRDRVAENIEAVIKTGEAISYQTRGVGPDGRESFYETFVGPLMQEGKIVGATLIITDITERKRAEEKLRESEERYHQFFEDDLTGDYISTQDGKFLACNPAFARMFGFKTVEEALATPADSIYLDPKDRKELLDLIKKKKKLEFYELDLRHRDGRILHIIENSVGKFNEQGELVQIKGYLIDNTEHKQAEEALRESEKQFRGLVENAPVGIYRTTPDGKILMVNPVITRMLGYSSTEELMSRNVEKDRLIPETSKDQFREQIERDGEIKGLESLWFKKDGSETFVRESARCIRDEEGNVQYYEGIVEEITEHRQLEEQFRQSQKMEGIGRLAGGVAHDFNNLLTVISGHAELAAITLNKQDPLHDDLKEIQNAAHRAAQLTRQLLAFSRKQTLQPKILDMNDIVRELDKMLKRVIGEDIDLETIAAPDLWRVNADPGQIEQVIINLAINARDAMPGGGKLVIETQNVELDEEYTGKHPEVKPGPHVMLAISDNGCGMKEELKSQIFEPFFTTKEKGKGTGLGLSTVYGIVKQSGGSIWVYSELDAGTTFKVYLPMVTQEADELSREADVSEAPRGTETILLVEDEEGVRKLAVRILKKLGYKVLDAESGVDALVMCQNRKKPVDIVVTDVVMPNMSGAEFIEKLREFWSDFKVLYMSGYTSNAIVHAGVLDKGTPYLQKPFRPVDIARKVRKVLDD